MSALEKSNDLISNFSTEKSNEKIDLNLLPATLEELDDYFEAFKILVECTKLQEFYNSFEGSRTFFTQTPSLAKRQISLFYHFTHICFC